MVGLRRALGELLVEAFCCLRSGSVAGDLGPFIAFATFEHQWIVVLEETTLIHQGEGGEAPSTLGHSFMLSLAGSGLETEPTFQHVPTGIEVDPQLLACAPFDGSHPGYSR